MSEHFDIKSATSLALSTGHETAIWEKRGPIGKANNSRVTGGSGQSGEGTL